MLLPARHAHPLKLYLMRGTNDDHQDSRAEFDPRRAARRLRHPQDRWPLLLKRFAAAGDDVDAYLLCLSGRS